MNQRLYMKHLQIYVLKFQELVFSFFCYEYIRYRLIYTKSTIMLNHLSSSENNMPTGIEWLMSSHVYVRHQGKQLHFLHLIVTVSTGNCISSPHSCIHITALAWAVQTCMLLHRGSFHKAKRICRHLQKFVYCSSAPPIKKSHKYK